MFAAAENSLTQRRAPCNKSVSSGAVEGSVPIGVGNHGQNVKILRQSGTAKDRCRHTAYDGRGKCVRA